MRRSTMLTAAVTVVASSFLGLAGPAGAGSGEELTKRQFLKSANATCQDAYEELDAKLEEVFAGLGQSDEPSAAQKEAAVATVVELLRPVVAELESLAGPAALEKKVQRFLDRFGAVVDEFEAGPLTMFEEEASGYPFAKPDALAKKIGLGSCAQRTG